MTNPVPYAEKKARVHSLIRLGEEKLEKLAQSMIGKSYEVLWESFNKEGFLTGYTSNFMKVKVQPQNVIQPKTISSIIIDRHDGSELVAKTLS